MLTRLMNAPNRWMRSDAHISLRQTSQMRRRLKVIERRQKKNPNKKRRRLKNGRHPTIDTIGVNLLPSDTKPKTNRLFCISASSPEFLCNTRQKAEQKL